MSFDHITTLRLTALRAEIEHRAALSALAEAMGDIEGANRHAALAAECQAASERIADAAILSEIPQLALLATGARA